MRQRWAAWVLLAIALAGCAKARKRTDAGAEIARVPRLAAMVVLWETDAFERGDTVAVDTTEISEDDRVPYYHGGAPAGRLPLEALGPTAPANMVVAADRLNVRRCRSTGCSVVGYVVRGQVVEVRDYADRWYRMVLENEPVGYLYAQFLQLPLLYARDQLEALEDETAEFYERELEHLTVDGEPVFTGYKVWVDYGLLSFEFFTPYKEGPALPVICDAMRDIARFVEERMAEVPSEIFPAYSAGVYHGNSNRVMVAGLAEEGNTFCMTPD